MRGERRYARPLIAGALALLLLALALYALDRAGGHVTSGDAFAAVAVAILAGAMLA